VRLYVRAHLLTLFPLRPEQGYENYRFAHPSYARDIPPHHPSFFPTCTLYTLPLPPRVKSGPYPASKLYMYMPGSLAVRSVRRNYYYKVYYGVASSYPGMHCIAQSMFNVQSLKGKRLVLEVEPLSVGENSRFSSLMAIKLT
jgi:hypothetical protein